MEPFPALSHWPTVVHVRTHAFSDRNAPFIRQTVLGLRPYVNNVVLAPSTDCANPADVGIELTAVRDFWNPLACLQIAQTLRRKYPNIRLVMGHMGNGTRAARLLSVMLRVPVLGTFGGSDVNVEFGKEIYQRAYADLLADPGAHFLTVAGYLRDKLLERGAPADRTFVWHRGVNMTDFELRPRPLSTTDKVRLVVSARFYEVKGHEYVIRAVAALKRQGRQVELVLLGDGPLRENMKALVGELGVGPDVKFVGQVSHDEVMHHLRAADICVHPSVTCAEGRIEGVPNAIMEAHAMGLPVVATRHGGISEVVLDGETGFMVDERNADQLAHRIGQLVDSRNLRSKMGLRGRAHIERDFNFSVQSRRLAARILQTIKAGELFDLRSWPMYSVRNEPPPSKKKGPRSRAVIAPDSEYFLKRMLDPRFVSTLKVVGTPYTLYRKAVWTVMFKPFVRFIGKELTGFIGQEMSTNLAMVVGSLNTHAQPAARVAETGTEQKPPLLMSSALCSDCPHAPAGAPWPDRPCPLDLACLQTLDREFSQPVARRSLPMVTTADGPQPLALTDGSLGTDGRLPFDDGSQPLVHFTGNLQKVADVPALLRELRRILASDGTLRLEVWPLPLGRDGLRLDSNLAVPFAQVFFPPAVLEEFLGKPVAPHRALNPTSLHKMVLDAGFRIREEHLPASHDDPCEMYVQARFAPLFRRAGHPRRQLARSFVVTLVPVSNPQYGVVAADDADDILAG